MKGTKGGTGEREMRGEREVREREKRDEGSVGSEVMLLPSLCRCRSSLFFSPQMI